ncbi:MAG: FAD:protein FMN transferase [Candidatus Microsaccharimonas sp.]
MMPSTKLKTTPKLNWRFAALGTEWEIVTDTPLLETAKASVVKTIENFDKTYSRFRKDSLVYAISKAEGEYIFPENARDVFDFYEDLYEISNGYVTPLIGATLEDMGYDSSYSLRPNSSIRITPKLSVLDRRANTITVNQPVVIDIGAAGKGYLVDLVVEQLISYGHKDFVVDASGDMRCVGKKLERVGLENPLNTNEVLGVVPLQNKALAASATNRRAWQGLHHIIDPKTSKPVDGVIATWVIADTAMIADGLATALFFCDQKQLAKRYTYEYMLIRKNGEVEYSDFFRKGVAGDLSGTI